MPSFLKTLFLLMFSFPLQCQAEKSPEAAKNELRIIHESARHAAVIQKDDAESKTYWAALKALGKVAKETKAPAWRDSLEPLDRVLVAVAIDHFEHPDRAQALSDWYGRFDTEVKPEVRGVPAPGLGRIRGTRIESLHEEHKTPEYRRAWEAWILAPATREKTMLLISLHSGLYKTGTGETALLLTAYADQTDPGPTGGSIAFAGSILMGIRTIESIEGLLRLMERSEKTGKSFLSGGRDVWFQDPATRSARIQDLFLIEFTGYNGNPLPGATSPFFHHQGKLWLPALTEILKRPELKPRDRVLLTKAKDIIEKHCMGDAPK